MKRVILFLIVIPTLMENQAHNKKRALPDTDSDSDTEVTFNSSSLKRARTSSSSMGKDKATPDFVDSIKEHFDKKTREITETFSGQLEPIKEKLEAHSKCIDDINQAIRRIEEEKGINTQANGSNMMARSLKEDRYWSSRSSGRFWSIPGNSEDELKIAAVNFMHHALLVPEDEKIFDRIISVRRSRTAYSSKIKDEVIVLFDSVSTRDFVF